MDRTHGFQRGVAVPVTESPEVDDAPLRSGTNSPKQTPKLGKASSGLDPIRSFPVPVSEGPVHPTKRTGFAMYGAMAMPRKLGEAGPVWTTG